MTLLWHKRQRQSKPWGNYVLSSIFPNMHHMSSYLWQNSLIARNQWQLNWKRKRWTPYAHLSINYNLIMLFLSPWSEGDPCSGNRLLTFFYEQIKKITVKHRIQHLPYENLVNCLLKNQKLTNDVELQGIKLLLSFSHSGKLSTSTGKIKIVGRSSLRHFDRSTLESAQAGSQLFSSFPTFNYY